MIAAKIFKPIFCFSGNLRQVRQAWHMVLSKIGDANVEVLQCGHNSETVSSPVRFACAADIILSLKNQDIFDHRTRVIKVRGWPSDYDILTPYLDLVNEKNVLVIIGKPGYHTGARWNSIASSNLYKEIQKKGKIYEFPTEAKSEREALKWVEEVFKEERVSISSEALARLIEMKGLDLDILYQEALKLCIYCGGGETISLKDVQECCSYEFLNTIWQFIDHINRQDCDWLLEFLQKFYVKNDRSLASSVSQILPVLQKHHLLLLLSKMRGGSDDDKRAFLSEFRRKDTEEGSNMPSLFTDGFLRANFNNPGFRKSITRNISDIAIGFLYVRRCEDFCRFYSSNETMIRLYLDSLVISLCNSVQARQTLLGDSCEGD